jgi:hypothetical protein
MWNLDQESLNVRDLSGSGSETYAGNGFKCLTYNFFFYLFDVLVVFNGSNPLYLPLIRPVVLDSFIFITFLILEGGGAAEKKLFFPGIPRNFAHTFRDLSGK